MTIETIWPIFLPIPAWWLRQRCGYIADGLHSPSDLLLSLGRSQYHSPSKVHSTIVIESRGTWLRMGGCPKSRDSRLSPIPAESLWRSLRSAQTSIGTWASLCATPEGGRALARTRLKTVFTRAFRQLRGAMVLCKTCLPLMLQWPWASFCLKAFLHLLLQAAKPSQPAEPQAQRDPCLGQWTLGLWGLCEAGQGATQPALCPCWACSLFPD